MAQAGLSASICYQKTVSTIMSSADQEVAAIRGEEKSKGGLSYEVILAEPVSDRPPSPLTVSTPTRPQPSEEEIERKLLAAKERREANRSINDVDEKINQAVQKRQEIVSTFVTKTKENLDAKMEESQEKREAHLNSLKTKLKEHLERVETIRVTNETKLQEIRQQIDEKLKSADEKRDEIIKQLQEKLRLHEEHIKSVKQSSEEKTKAMEEQIHSKIQLAAEKREEIEKEMLEKLKEQDRRGELARQKKENRLSGGGQCDGGETASSG
uniref:Stathmin n=1 Tax=Daphnia galeata TaxID=27404 RepID=A0A8J2RZJ8_9CRUS|nr:unnamed protein product [Daphnia galeata]